MKSTNEFKYILTYEGFQQQKRREKHRKKKREKQEKLNRERIWKEREKSIFSDDPVPPGGIISRLE
jgi:tRNA nucleotidyltransferase/poly(A) polymerase